MIKMSNMAMEVTVRVAIKGILAVNRLGLTLQTMMGLKMTILLNFSRILMLIRSLILL
jgi:hypothetical protein